MSLKSKLKPMFNRKPERVVKKSDVKLCILCGTLNHERNAECWTCGWQGSFHQDAQIIALAWNRLVLQYEEVRLEHVTARRSQSPGHFGAARPASFLAGVLARISRRWECFQTQRDLRMAQRVAALNSRIPSRPDQLGV